jgi:hypothetical protein
MKISRALGVWSWVAALLVLPAAQGSVSIEVQVGGLDGVPAGTPAALVVDTAGDGFAAPAGPVSLVAGQAAGGSDDLIVAVFATSSSVAWDRGSGISAFVGPLSYGALGVAEGMPVAVYVFVEGGEGVDDEVLIVRPTRESEVTGNMGLGLPADGGHYQWGLLASALGGGADRVFAALAGEVLIFLAGVPAAGGDLDGGGAKLVGSEATVVAAARAGYRFVRWSEGGLEVSTDASYLFEVEVERELVAEFERIYGVVAVAAGNGTVSSDIDVVVEGGAVEFTASPAAKHVVGRWLVGGVVAQVGGANFVLDGVGSDLDVRVEFEYLQDNFNGDRNNDLVWQNQRDGKVRAWLLDGVKRKGGAKSLSTQPKSADWQLVGVGDFRGNGMTDLVFQHRKTGAINIWWVRDVMRRSGTGGTSLQPGTSTWRVAGTGDFDGDGRMDLAVQDLKKGRVRTWRMDSKRGVLSVKNFSHQLKNTDWRLRGAGDVDGDGKADLVWQHQKKGQITVWLMDGTNRLASRSLTAQPGNASWRVRAVADYDGDGKADLVLQSTKTGKTMVWYLEGNVVTKGGLLPTQEKNKDWQVRNTGGW